MNDYVYVGKIVNTHGIKGELRILSDFELKSDCFKVGNCLYIGNNKIKEEIISYRVHKNFDMVVFKGYSNINEVLKYVNCNVYILRSDLNLQKDYLLSDLINLDIYEDNTYYGKVIDYYNYNGNILLEINGHKNFYIPYQEEYIKKVDLEKKIIQCQNIKELIL